ncbi:MAG: ATP-grasp domain-containing protein, partial [Cucumibacter sp.]
RFLMECGLPVAPWQAIDSIDALKLSFVALGSPAVLKTRRLGYDGKGQIMVRAGDDLERIFKGLNGAAAFLEAFIPFEREVSVFEARGDDGATAAYDVIENIHENHILRSSLVPVKVSPEVAEAAVAAARTIAQALDYVGVLGVEFFVTGRPEKPLLINEFAPRVHNSGHWTEAAAVTSQFTQHIKALAGWPLGDPGRFADAEMRNLLGDEVLKATSIQGVSVHVYGKAEIRPGRKMGHTIRLIPLNH